MPLEAITLFLLSSAVLAFTPGPDNLFVLLQSATYGKRAGIFVTLGLCTGLIFHTTLVAVGVAAIFATSSLAFTLLKWVGAAYLVYLAIGAFKAGNTQSGSDEQQPLGISQLYARGIFMNITNPKVAIFFLAFLPQFVVSGDTPVSGQIFVLGALFMVTTLVVFGAIAWFSGALGDYLRRSPAIEKGLNRVAGLVFIGLAIRLVLSER